MTKLSAEDAGFMRLIARSPDQGEGWRAVSRVVWPLVESVAAKELIEAEGNLDSGGRVRLSGRGSVLADYL